MCTWPASLSGVIFSSTTRLHLTPSSPTNRCLPSPWQPRFTVNGDLCRLLILPLNGSGETGRPFCRDMSTDNDCVLGRYVKWRTAEQNMLEKPSSRAVRAGKGSERLCSVRYTLLTEKVLECSFPYTDINKCSKYSTYHVCI